jgi:uncharacterized protein YbcI
VSRPSLEATTSGVSLESPRRTTRPRSAGALRHDPISHYGFPVGERSARCPGYPAAKPAHNGPVVGEGNGAMRITRAQRNAVAEKITSLERTFYGRGPRNVQVSVSDDDPVSLVVLSIDSLTVADAVLGERGDREAVIRHHEALHRATRADFLEAIEAIVGATVTAYLAQVHPTTGTAIRVFVFSEYIPEESGLTRE